MKSICRVNGKVKQMIPMTTKYLIGSARHKEVDVCVLLIQVNRFFVVLWLFAMENKEYLEQTCDWEQ